MPCVNSFWVRTSSRFLLALCGMVAASSIVQAENWAQWRGPHFNGVSSEKGIARDWSKDKNVAWRVPLPGASGATPVVFGDQIFVTSVDGNELILLSIGTDGKQQWRQVVGTGNKAARDDEGNSASPSPITDGKHVWSFMGTGDLACFTVAGEPVWKTNLQEKFGDFDIQFGMSTTPVLHDGKLYFQLIHGNMQGPGEPAVVAALDASNGETVWRVDRKTGAVQENKHSYASTILYDFDGLTLLITHGGDYTIAYDPKTGDEVWRFGSFNPQGDPNWEFNPYFRLVASPGIAPGLVVIPTAKRGPVFGIRPDAKGNLAIDGDAVLWKMERGTPDVPTPLIHDGLVYLCDEGGIFRCLDAKTGEEFYRERTHVGRHRASPIYADGHIYLTARDGHVTVVKAGKTFEKVAENDTGEDQSATPIVSDGTLYLRTFNALWAIRAK